VNIPVSELLLDIKHVKVVEGHVVAISAKDKEESIDDDARVAITSRRSFLLNFAVSVSGSIHLARTCQRMMPKWVC